MFISSSLIVYLRHKAPMKTFEQEVKNIGSGAGHKKRLICGSEWSVRAIIVLSDTSN